LLREKALDIEDFNDFNGWIDEQHSVVWRTVLGECKSVDSPTEGMEKGTVTEN
jgi:hypothetical protein